MAEIKNPDMPDKTAQLAVDSKAAKDTQSMPGGSPPDPTTKEAAAPAPYKIDDGLEPPAPFDIPAPGKVVSFDTISGAGPDKSVADEKLRQEQETFLKSLDEKADSMKDTVKPKKAPAKSGKQKSAPAKNAPPPKEAPAPAEETPPVPREAPRPAEAEQVVFIPLTEFHAFKDHPCSTAFPANGLSLQNREQPRRCRCQQSRICSSTFRQKSSRATAPALSATRNS